MNSHVCHVINSLGAGGAEQYVVQLSNYLFAQGHRVSIVAGEPQTLRERLDAGVHVETLQLHPGAARSLGTYLLLLPQAIRHLVRFFRAEGVTVVHTHLAASALPAWIAAKLCGIPVMHSKMHTEAIPSRYERAIFASRLPLFLVNRFLAFTRYIESEIVRYWHAPTARIVLSSIGVDTQRFVLTEALRESSRRDLGLKPDSKVMLVVSRFYPDKDVALAIHAARAVDDPEAVLLVAGDGPERPTLEQLERDLPGRTRIVFLGLLADPRPAYAAADLLLQTTRGPNLGTVVLEGMAMSLPVVIAYRDEEERKMALDTVDGLELGAIAEAKPAVMAAALAKLLADRARLGELRREVREFVELRHARLSVYPVMAKVYTALTRQKG